MSDVASFIHFNQTIHEKFKEGFQVRPGFITCCEPKTGSVSKYLIAFSLKYNSKMMKFVLNLQWMLLRLYS